MVINLYIFIKKQLTNNCFFVIIKLIIKEDIVMEMKKINRKRLNNKGFTLIELLAVVVILAIVMGIAATSVLTSINNSRKSSLYSAAQNAANTLNTWVSEDMLVTDNSKKKLGDTFVNNTQGTGANTWICFGSDSIKTITNGGTSATLLNALGFGDNGTGLVIGATFAEETDSTLPTCSALRYNTSSGGYEVVLVAANGGKYYVSNEANKNFAYSRAQGPGESISD